MPDNELPSNSHKARAEAASIKAHNTPAAVVKGKAKKKSNFAELFLSEDIKDFNLGEYAAKTYIIPGIKEILFNAVVGSLSMILFDGKKGTAGLANNLFRQGNITKINYSAASQGLTSTKISQAAAAQNVSRNELDVTKVVFDNRDDADAVLSGLCDMGIEYGMASVADFYSLAQMDYDYVMGKWGWLRDAIMMAKVMPTRGGFYLEISRPGQLPI